MEPNPLGSLRALRGHLALYEPRTPPSGAPLDGLGVKRDLLLVRDTVLSDPYKSLVYQIHCWLWIRNSAVW